MYAKAITPILNVSDMERSFKWFEALGWRKLWDWGEPPTFGAVGSGECEIFMCVDGQGHKQTDGGGFQEEVGVWMSIWVDDVDAIYETCKANGIEVTWGPVDEPWCVREMHVRHPDGHTFRISQGLAEE